MYDPNKIAASELLRLAKSLVSFTMTESEWKEYQKLHPKADKNNHTITQDSASQDGTPSEGTSSGGQGKKEKDEVTKKTQRELVKKYKNHVTLSKQVLKNTLSHGSYTCISAGPNTDIPTEKEMERDDPFFHERHMKLQADLEKLGMKYTEVVGNYGSGPERTFMVIHDHKGGFSEKTKDKGFMVHRHAGKADEIKKLEALGAKYKQNSILHGDQGKNQLHFTSGPKKGKKCGGEGWQEVPDADNYFTEVELKGREHTKVNMDIHECFEPGGLLATP